MLAALASPPATKALDPDPFPRHSLRHAVYAALLHFGFETAHIKNPLRRRVRIQGCGTEIVIRVSGFAQTKRELKRDSLPPASVDRRCARNRAQGAAPGQCGGKLTVLTLVEPRALEIEERDAGQVRERERTEGELGPNGFPVVASGL